jgi:hypothetical protein
MLGLSWASRSRPSADEGTCAKQAILLGSLTILESPTLIIAVNLEKLALIGERWGSSGDKPPASAR